MIKVEKFINFELNDSGYRLEEYLNDHNITREQIISISYGIEEKILLVYEDK